MSKKFDGYPIEIDFWYKKSTPIHATSNLISAQMQYLKDVERKDAVMNNGYQNIEEFLP